METLKKMKIRKMCLCRHVYVNYVKRVTIVRNVICSKVTYGDNNNLATTLWLHSTTVVLHEDAKTLFLSKTLLSVNMPMHNIS